MTEKKFRIAFSGRHYPSYRPSAVTIIAESEEDAKKWAYHQMSVWEVERPEKVRVKIREIGATPEEGKP